MIKNIKNRIIPILLILCFFILNSYIVNAEYFYDSEDYYYDDSEEIVCTEIKPKKIYKPIMVSQIYYSNEENINYHFETKYFKARNNKITLVITNLKKDHKYVIQRKKGKKWVKIKTFTWNKSSIGQNSKWKQLGDESYDDYIEYNCELANFFSTYNYTDKKLKPGTTYYYRIVDKTSNLKSHKKAYYTSCKNKYAKKLKQNRNKVTWKKEKGASKYLLVYSCNEKIIDYFVGKKPVWHYEFHTYCKPVKKNKYTFKEKDGIDCKIECVIPYSKHGGKIFVKNHTIYQSLFDLESEYED